MSIKPTQSSENTAGQVWMSHIRVVIKSWPAWIRTMTTRIKTWGAAVTPRAKRSFTFSCWCDPLVSRPETQGGIREGCPAVRPKLGQRGRRSVGQAAPVRAAAQRHCHGRPRKDCQSLSPCPSDCKMNANKPPNPHQTHFFHMSEKAKSMLNAAAALPAEL